MGAKEELHLCVRWGVSEDGKHGVVKAVLLIGMVMAVESRDGGEKDCEL